jgi:hypothetical protein
VGQPAPWLRPESTKIAQHGPELTRRLSEMGIDRRVRAPCGHETMAAPASRGGGGGGDATLATLASDILADSSVAISSRLCTRPTT